MRFLTLLAVLLLAACNSAETGRDNEAPVNFPEIY